MGIILSPYRSKTSSEIKFSMNISNRKKRVVNHSNEYLDKNLISVLERSLGLVVASKKISIDDIIHNVQVYIKKATQKTFQNKLDRMFP